MTWRDASIKANNQLYQQKGRVLFINLELLTSRIIMVPSAAEETEFMAKLLQGLDNSFGDTVFVPTTTCFSSPPPPRTPPKRSPISPKQKSNHNAVSKDGDFDMVAFFEGSENWDLDDYSFSPIKPNKPTLVAKVGSQYRYIFEED